MQSKRSMFSSLLVCAAFALAACSAVAAPPDPGGTSQSVSASIASIASIASPVAGNSAATKSVGAAGIMSNSAATAGVFSRQGEGLGYVSMRGIGSSSGKAPPAYLGAIWQAYDQGHMRLGRQTMKMGYGGGGGCQRATLSTATHPSNTDYSLRERYAG